MGLIQCPDCGADVSDMAPSCPKCARPLTLKKTGIDRKGAWCPNCGNRDSYRIRRVGCFFWVLVVFTLGLPLLFYPWLPQAWRCERCSNEWKA